MALSTIRNLRRFLVYYLHFHQRSKFHFYFRKMFRYFHAPISEPIVDLLGPCFRSIHQCRGSGNRIFQHEIEMLRQCCLEKAENQVRVLYRCHHQCQIHHRESILKPIFSSHLQLPINHRKNVISLLFISFNSNQSVPGT